MKRFSILLLCAATLCVCFFADPGNAKVGVMKTSAEPQDQNLIVPGRYSLKSRGKPVLLMDIYKEQQHENYKYTQGWPVLVWGTPKFRVMWDCVKDGSELKCLDKDRAQNYFMKQLGENWDDAVNHATYIIRQTDKKHVKVIKCDPTDYDEENESGMICQPGSVYTLQQRF